MCDLMLRVENVSKEYRLGAIGGTTLREEIQRKQAKLLRKEDPTTILGQNRTNEKGMFMALSNISFEVKKGEALGIIGHNGAGKSTLLKLITQITAPTNGTIYLNGRVASMLEVGTGFHPELTGRENIYVNGAILGMTKREIDSKIEEIINFSECRQFIDTPVKRYSSGMYVKLAFSVAANLDSEIMIMDEVLAVGDVAFQQKCIDRMNEASANEGRTILYVSHNMNTIRKLCDRCLVLDRGRIVFNGDVESAIKLYTKHNDISSSCVDLTQFKRHGHSTRIAEMLNIELLDRRQPIYSYGEMIRFVLHWSTKEIDHKFLFRICVATRDDEGVGTSLCANGIITKREDNYTRFSLDTRGIVPGDYFLDFTLYENEGNETRFDCVRRCLSIKITDNKDNTYFRNWTKGWGYVLLNDILVQDEF